MICVVVATTGKIPPIRRPGQATDLLRVSSNSGELDNLSMTFIQVLLGTEIGPLNGIIMKVTNIIADQQIFACYIQTSEIVG